MKKIFWYSLLVFITIVIITLVVIIEKKVEVKKITPNDEKSEKLKLLNNIDKRIDYFNYSYLERYINYKQKNYLLSDIDIITRVNLGLDRPFYQNTRQSNNLNKINVLVNKYIYLPKDYIPDNLVNVSLEFSSSTRQLVYEAKEAFEKMAIAAKNSGYNIRIISAYRSYDYQKGLYESYTKQDGIELADTYSARPGHSEHQTGLVIDIDNKVKNFNNFEDTEEFTWMNSHAHEYGFILRYPKDKECITGYKYESWHYRYVGSEIATFIKNNNLTLDEYYVRFVQK